MGFIAPCSFIEGGKSLGDEQVRAARLAHGRQELDDVRLGLFFRQRAHCLPISCRKPADASQTRARKMTGGSRSLSRARRLTAQPFSRGARRKPEPTRSRRKCPFAEQDKTLAAAQITATAEKGALTYANPLGLNGRMEWMIDRCRTHTGADFQSGVAGERSGIGVGARGARAGWPDRQPAAVTKESRGNRRRLRIHS